MTAPLVDALLRLSVTNQGQDRAVRQALLDSVLDDSSESMDVRTLTARMAALGVECSGDLRTMVIRERRSVANQSGRVDLDQVGEWLHARMEDVGIRYLLSSRSAELVLLAGSASVVESLAAEMVEQWTTLTAGFGRTATAVMEIRASYRDAQIAVRHLNVQADRSIMSFDNLDVVTQLLAEVPVERFAATAAPIAAMLAENPIQLEALKAYFSMNRDVKAAADSIFLHPNTLRYRLERLEQALGRSLREPSVTASLYCVLTLMDDLIPPEQIAESSDPIPPFGTDIRVHETVNFATG
ncbi:PucR family transcriptional regulator [Rhodococcus qingshengii]|uniref:PucR family transcriptional regulator n=2 Tax=Rhodococcus erythropolis group TaxID=2840174 RepID=UPI0027E259A9|nr:helix-turn-helix domain-containing protein [Rhodococcus qingshengii]